MFIVYDLEQGPRYDSELTIYGVYEDEDEAEQAAKRMGCTLCESDYYPKQN